MRWLALAFVLAAGPAAAADPVTVKVVTPDGKPAAGAKVWTYFYPNDGEPPPAEPTPAVTAADGRATVTVPDRPNRSGSVSLFARDAAGHVGGGQTNFLRAEDADDGVATIRLVEGADRPGRVTDPAGKPVAGAVVTPRAAYRDDGGSRESFAVPPWEQPGAAVRTGADGRFALKAMPPGRTLFFKVAADGFGETWYDAKEDELAVVFAPTGTVRLAVAGVDPAALKGVSWWLSAAGTDGAGRAPSDGKAVPRRYASGKADGKPELVAANVVPGRYTATFYNVAAVGVPDKAEPFDVPAGGTAKVVVRFGPGAKVTGRVVTADTRKVVPKAQVFASVGVPGEPHARHIGSVETAADGTFTVHGPAGQFALWMNDAPDGFVVPPYDQRKGLIDPLQVGLGATVTIPDVRLPRAVSFVGKAVLPGGKPAAGAVIDPPVFVLPHGAKPVTAGPDGVFEIKNLPPGEVISLRVRLGKAVNKPESYEVGKEPGPTVIELSEANAGTIRGRVTSADGKSIAGARVELEGMIRGVGRHSNTGQGTRGGATKTDADGRFEFTGLWAGDQYGVKVTVAGFAPADVRHLTPSAGEVRELPPLKLARAGLAVAGVVLGADGQPVPGAAVFGVDGPKPFHAVAGADGRFTLTGYADAPGFLFARKDGYRLAAVPVTPGGSAPVSVTLRRADSPPTPPVVSPEHLAAREKFLRHLLQKMWDTRAQFDYGRSAVSRMARLDPVAARKWVEEERQRTGGKTNLAHLVDEAERERTLFATAQEDVDEAVTVLRQVKGEWAANEMLTLGRRLLAVDKGKAARLVEEATVRARTLPVPRNVYTLAQAGELAILAGNKAGGEKLIREAAGQAAKLSPDGRDEQAEARGMVAARLAPFDWPAAKALLDPLKESNLYNRHLCSAADKVARTDVPAAKKLFDLFRPDNSFAPYYARLSVAYRAVAADPDEAERIVNSVAEGNFRFQGLVRLAGLVAAKDKPRAVRLIDTAMAILEMNPQSFQSMTYFGGRAGCALLAVHKGKAIGHPDLAGLVAKALAVRQTLGDAMSSPETLAEQTVSFAAGLALVDPASARQVLAGVAPPDRYAELALTQPREWTIALALADPGRARGLIDAVFEKAAADGDQQSLSRHGILEIGSILTAADPYQELAGYAQLIREYREPE